MSGWLAIHVEFYHVKISHMIALFSGLCRVNISRWLIENKRHVTIKTVHACPPNFQVSCPTFECRIRRFGNNLQRFAPNIPTFRQNVRANLSNLIQDLFWHVTFSNEDFKMVEDGAASLAIIKI